MSKSRHCIIFPAYVTGTQVDGFNNLLTTLLLPFLPVLKGKKKSNENKSGELIPLNVDCSVPTGGAVSAQLVSHFTSTNLNNQAVNLQLSLDRPSNHFLYQVSDCKEIITTNTCPAINYIHTDILGGVIEESKQSDAMLKNKSKLKPFSERKER